MNDKASDGGWWCIHEDEIRDLLIRAHKGEDPGLLIAEAYVNSDVENYKEGEP